RKTTEGHISLWDTAGEERFLSLSRSYYRDADAVLLVYSLSLTRRCRIIGLQSWTGPQGCHGPVHGDRSPGRGRRDQGQDGGVGAGTRVQKPGSQESEGQRAGSQEVKGPRVRKQGVTKPGVRGSRSKE
uniref:Uncharacterized protein n=1 Tax=Podarcis muralis TaxID=64176 RepID=A0A670J2W1_PODMU